MKTGQDLLELYFSAAGHLFQIPLRGGKALRQGVQTDQQGNKGDTRHQVCNIERVAEGGRQGIDAYRTHQQAQNGAHDAFDHGFGGYAGDDAQAENA